MVKLHTLGTATSFLNFDFSTVTDLSCRESCNLSAWVCMLERCFWNLNFSLSNYARCQDFARTVQYIPDDFPSCVCQRKMSHQTFLQYCSLWSRQSSCATDHTEVHELYFEVKLINVWFLCVVATVRLRRVQGNNGGFSLWTHSHC